MSKRFITSVVVGCLFFAITPTISAQFMSRFELSELINNAQCVQCRDDITLIERYDQARLDDKRTELGVFIEDITTPDDALYGGVSYFTCTASAIEAELLQGFPRSDNPYCRGLFCGERMVTASELVTALYRVERNDLLSSYRANRSAVSEWLGRTGGSVEQSAAVNSAINGCESDDDGTCAIITGAQLDVYMQFCAENANECEWFTPRSSGWGSSSAHAYRVALENAQLIPSSFGYTQYESVARSDIEDLIALVKVRNDCSDLRDDRDRDGIRDEADNCLTTYNPNQTDRDNDQIGDVCDDDIDNDGVLNELGVVDDEGRLNQRLVEQSDDNCVNIENTDQLDQDGNGIGERCERSQSLVFAPGVTPLEGVAPLGVEGTLQGPFNSIVWNRETGLRGLGRPSQHVYYSPGSYLVEVTAKDEQGVGYRASQTVRVYSPEEEQIGLVVACTPQTHSSYPAISQCISRSTGQPDSLRWTGGGTQVTTPADGTPSFEFDGRGVYPIEVEAISADGEVIASAQTSVGVRTSDTSTDELPLGSAITTERLTYQPDETITFNTILSNIIPDEIERVQRSRESPDDRESGELTQDHVFSTPGAYTVYQRLSFRRRSRSPHINALTVYIERTSSPAVELRVQDGAGSGLFTTGQPIALTHQLTDLDPADIVSVERDRGDGMSTTTDGVDASHTYTTGGTYTITTVVTTSSGEQFTQSITITVDSAVRCDGSDQLVCDLDEDGIPDLCDDDIDGDGVTNWLGLLIGERPDCEITPEEVDGERLDEYVDHCANGGPGCDNCFLIDNPSQSDEDGNGVGDACEGGGDSSGSADATPTGGTPSAGGGGGSADGGSADGGGAGDGGQNAGDAGGDGDGDGPPQSSGPDTNDGDTTVEVDQCTQCPCQTADLGSQLADGDRVRALLYDESGEILYEYSIPEQINYDERERVAGG